jgi:hypothetical protein
VNRRYGPALRDGAFRAPVVCEKPPKLVSGRFLFIGKIEIHRAFILSCGGGNP